MTNSVATCQISHLPFSHGRAVAMIVCRDVHDPSHWYPVSAAIRGSYFDDGDCLEDIDENPVNDRVFAALGFETAETAVEELRPGNFPLSLENSLGNVHETFLDVVLFKESIFDLAIRAWLEAEARYQHREKFNSGWESRIPKICDVLADIAATANNTDMDKEIRSLMLDNRRRDLAQGWYTYESGSDAFLVLRNHAGLFEDQLLNLYHRILVEAVGVEDKETIISIRDMMFEHAAISITMGNARSDWVPVRSCQQVYDPVTPVRLAIARETVRLAPPVDTVPKNNWARFLYYLSGRR